MAHVTKYPNESDHSLLYTSIFTAKIDYGPGIIRCNASLTDNLDTLGEISAEITNQISTLNNIDTLMDWDRLKQTIRLTYLKHGRIASKKNKDSNV